MTRSSSTQQISENREVPNTQHENAQNDSVQNASARGVAEPNTQENKTRTDWNVIVNRVAKDSRDNAEQYLNETTVPGGGE